MNMQEEELRQLLRKHGWNLYTREMRGKKRNGFYLYARKWLMPDVYISKREDLPELHQEKVLEKIGAVG